MAQLIAAVMSSSAVAFDVRPGVLAGEIGEHRCTSIWLDLHIADVFDKPIQSCFISTSGLGMNEILHVGVGQVLAAAYPWVGAPRPGFTARIWNSRACHFSMMCLGGFSLPSPRSSLPSVLIRPPGRGATTQLRALLLHHGFLYYGPRALTKH